MLSFAITVVGRLKEVGQSALRVTRHSNKKQFVML